jgi:hypothetical protein
LALAPQLRSANSSTCWPPGWGTGPQPRSGGQPIGPREPPGGDRDAAREHRLERADRRQLLDHRGLELGEVVDVLLRQHHMFLRAQAVLQRILRRTRFALRRLRTARLRAVLAARFGAGTADGDGRARRGAIIRHGGILSGGGGGSRWGWMPARSAGQRLRSPSV